MKYIANVLTTEKFDEKTYYNVVKSEENLIEGIPTLIVGWEKAKEVHPEASILNWRIDDNTYWTFGKRVRREKNEEDIKKFKKMMLERVIEKADYWFFNVLTATKQEKINFNVALSDSRRKYVLISGEMAYVFFPETSETIGVSLYDIDYSGVGRDKILKLFEKNNATTIVKERDFVSFETRELITNKKFIIPYLSSLNS